MGNAEARISDAHYAVESEFERSSKKLMRDLVPSDTPLYILDVG